MLPVSTYFPCSRQTNRSRYSSLHNSRRVGVSISNLGLYGSLYKVFSHSKYLTAWIKHKEETVRMLKWREMEREIESTLKKKQYKKLNIYLDFLLSNINTLKVLNSEQSASPVACRFLRELTSWTRSAGSDITRMYGFVILASRASLSPLSLYMPECTSINTGLKKKQQPKNIYSISLG